MARKWRQEMDLGTTAKAIGDRDQFDPRTVRQQVARARRSDGPSAARGEILRDAIRTHQAHLVGIAGVLVKQLRPDGILRAGGTPDDLPPSALADHLGRSRLGKGVRRWLALSDEVSGLYEDLRNRAEADAGVASLAAESVGPLAIAEELWKLAWGGDPTVLGWLEPERLGAEPDAHRMVLRAASQQWEEFAQMRDRCGEAKVLADQLVEGLRVVRLRGFIAGDCRYCPDAQGD